MFNFVIGAAFNFCDVLAFLPSFTQCGCFNNDVPWYKSGLTAWFPGKEVEEHFAKEHPSKAEPFYCLACQVITLLRLLGSYLF